MTIIEINTRGQLQNSQLPLVLQYVLQDTYIPIISFVR